MDNGASSYRRFLAGDESAFDEIIKEYFHGLVFFINRYVQDLHAAEDIAIDALSDLIVHRHRYHFGTSLKTYLFMMGRSRALDYIKHRKIMNETELSDADGVTDDSQDPYAILLADERKRLVHQALEKLPADMQTAVHLVYFAELSYEETAKVMKKNRKQVDNLLYRAKKELRIILGKEGEQFL